MTTVKDNLDYRVESIITKEAWDKANAWYIENEGVGLTEGMDVYAVFDGDVIVAVMQTGNMYMAKMSFDKNLRWPNTAKSYDLFQNQVFPYTPYVMVEETSPLMNKAKQVMRQITKPMRLFAMKLEPIYKEKGG